MKPGEKILALFFFIMIGLTGLALIGLGSWLLLSPIQSAAQAETPIFLTPTPATAEDIPIIITATLAPSQTTQPTDVPAPSNAPTATLFLTPTPTQGAPLTWQACPGAHPSELHVGDKAMVSLNPPLANNVRAQPETTSKFLFAIQPGEVVDILEGPGCSNNWVWWQIKTQDGRTGWTAEGDGTEYWLVPAK